MKLKLAPQIPNSLKDPIAYWDLLWIVFGLSAVLFHAGRHKLWIDEVLQVAGTLESYRDILLSSAPGGLWFQVLMAPWIRLQPENIFWVELPSALASFGAMVYFWLTARIVVQQGLVRWLITPLIFTNILLVMIGTEIRPYGLLTLGVSMMLYSLIRNRGIRSGFVFGAIITSIAHPIGILYTGLVVLTGLIYIKSVDSRKTIIRLGVITCFLVTLIVGIAIVATIVHLSNNFPYIKDIPKQRIVILPILKHLYGFLISWQPSLFALVLGFIALIFAKGMRLLVLTWIVIPISFVFVVMYAGNPLFALRYILPSFVPVYLFILTGLSRVRLGKPIAATITFIVVWGNLIGHQWYMEYPYHPVPVYETHDGQGNYPWTTSDTIAVSENAMVVGNFMPILLAWEWRTAAHLQQGKPKIALSANQINNQQTYPTLLLKEQLILLDKNQAVADWFFIPKPPFGTNMVVNIFPWWDKLIRIKEKKHREAPPTRMISSISKVVGYKTYAGVWLDLRLATQEEKRLVTSNSFGFISIKLKPEPEKSLDE